MACCIWDLKNNNNNNNNNNAHTHYFLNVVRIKLNSANKYTLRMSRPCVVLFLTDNITSYRCTAATFVWCLLLLCCCTCDRLHYKSSINRSETSFLIYLCLVWQNFRSEMMFWDKYACSVTIRLLKWSLRRNIGRGVGVGVGGGWLPTTPIFTDVGAAGRMSSVTCNVNYLQHSNISIFAWLQSWMWNATCNCIYHHTAERISYRLVGLCHGIHVACEMFLNLSYHQ